MDFGKYTRAQLLEALEKDAFEGEDEFYDLTMALLEDEEIRRRAFNPVFNKRIAQIIADDEMLPSLVFGDDDEGMGRLVLGGVLDYVTSLAAKQLNIDFTKKKALTKRPSLQVIK